MARHKFAKEFHLVFSPDGPNSLVKHPSFEEADDAAKELATSNPGKSFYVLSTVGHYRGIVKVTHTYFSGDRLRVRKKKGAKRVS